MTTDALNQPNAITYMPNMFGLCTNFTYDNTAFT